MTKWEDDEEEASTNFWCFVMLVFSFVIGFIMVAPFNVNQWATDPIGVILIDALFLSIYGLLIGIIVWANNTE